MCRREPKISNPENRYLLSHIKKHNVFDFPSYEIMRTFYRRVHLFNFNLQTIVKGGGLGSCSVGIQFQFYKKTVWRILTQ